MSFPVPLIDAILVGVLIEGAAIAIWLRRRSRRRMVTPVMLFLASGALLMIALRLALIDASFLVVAAPLLGAFLAHLAVLRRCFKRLSENP